MTPVELQEYIITHCKQIKLNERTYFIVEEDLLLPENALESYTQDALKPFRDLETDPLGSAGEPLVAATIGGKKVRWELGTTLKWHLDEDSFKGFNEELAIARQTCENATEDWNTSFKQVGVNDKISFEEAKSEQDSHFSIRFQELLVGYVALGFFPHPTIGREARNIILTPHALTVDNGYNKTGIMRHELGHVLGFRHEHIRPENYYGQWKLENIVGNMGSQVLTEYDPQSCMHYFEANGRGTTEFEITSLDREGVKKMYGSDTDPEEFHEITLS